MSGKKQFYAQFPGSALGNVLVEIDAESEACAEVACAEFYASYGFVIRSGKTAHELVKRYEFHISSKKIVQGTPPRVIQRARRAP